MNKIRNSIIIIHDYEFKNISQIQQEANSYWVEYYVNNAGMSSAIVSPIMCSIFNREYTFIIDGDCAMDSDLKNQFIKDRLAWCEYVYRKYLPQNITIVNIGDDGESFIENQFPKIEEYKNDKYTGQ